MPKPEHLNVLSLTAIWRGETHSTATYIRPLGVPGILSFLSTHHNSDLITSLRPETHAQTTWSYNN